MIAVMFIVVVVGMSGGGRGCGGGCCGGGDGVYCNTVCRTATATPGLLQVSQKYSNLEIFINPGLPFHVIEI